MRRTTIVYYLVFLSIMIGASAALPSALWGAGAWNSVSFTGALVIALTLLVVISGRVSDRLLSILPEGPRLSRPVAILALPLAVILLWLLRPGHLLLGGLQETVARIAAGAWTSPAAPLATAVTQGVFQAINSLFFIHPVTAISIISVLLSIPFILIVRSLALTLVGREGPQAREWVTAAAMLFAGGYSIVFFGGNSIYAAAVVVSALFVLSALKHLRGEAPLWLPMALLLLALFTHYSNIFLAPGAVFLLVRAGKDKGTRGRAALLAVIAILAVAAIDILISLSRTGPAPSAVLMSVIRGSIEAASSRAPGLTFSDWGNVLLVLGPVVLLSLVLLVSGRRPGSGGDDESPGRSFLTLSALSALVLVLAASPLIQRGLRWEIFASTGPVFACLALTLMKDRSGDRRTTARASLLILVLSLFHLSALIAIGTSRNLGIERLRGLPLPGGAAEKIVGMDLMATEDYKQASEWLATSGESMPDDAGTWFALGQADMKNEDYLDAISHINRAVKISPDDPTYRETLAEAYIEKRWFEEAVSELEKLTAAYPSELKYPLRLGYALNHGGMYERAVTVYGKVLDSEPGNMNYRRNLASALINLGASYQQDEDYTRAEECYRKVINLLPTSWVAKNNLAMVYMDREDYEEAYRILDEAIRGNDVAARLHYNMALVQEQRGEYQSAFEHLTRSIELSPGIPAPEEVMRRIWEKAEAQKKEAGE